MSDIIGKLIGRKFRFKSYNYGDRCIRHRNYEVWLDKDEDSGLFKLDSTFTVIPGLSGSGISFKSENYPDHFIRHSNYECYIHKYDGSDLFKNDASWIPRTGLANYQGYTFESANKSGFFMRHRGYRVRIDRIDGSDLFKKDATWVAYYLKDIRTDGEWKLVYGNDNEASDWQWSQEVTVGIDISKAESVSKTEELAWKVGMEAGAAGWGMSVKAMFEVSGQQSVTEMSESTWHSSHSEKTTKTYSGKKGEGFYLWQWTLYAYTSDGICIGVRTNLYDETTVNKLPEYTY